MSDKQFANGIIYKEPSAKAPDFVVGGLSVKKSEFIPFLNSQDGDWVNLSIKLSKAGKPYIELDLWKPENRVNGQNNGQNVQINEVVVDDNESLPF